MFDNARVPSLEGALAFIYGKEVPELILFADFNNRPDLLLGDTENKEDVNHFLRHRQFCHR